MNIKQNVRGRVRVRAGVAGGLQGYSILGNSDFLGSKRHLGKVSFKDVFMLFFL